MAFVGDLKNRRTYDPERGYELLGRSSSSDGTTRFELQGPEGNWRFSAVSYGEELRPDELARLGPDFNKRPVVWSITGWDAHWGPIIKEAMLAFKHSHGACDPKEAFFVRFGNKESVFDD